MAFLMIASFFFERPRWLRDLFLCRRAAQVVRQLDGGPAPLGQQFRHVCRDTDRPRRVDDRPLDALLDPVAGIGAEARVHRRVEPLDGAEQAHIPFGYKVVQRQPLAGITAGDIHDKPQVGANHAIACFHIPREDANGEFTFLDRTQKRSAIDLAEVAAEWGAIGADTHDVTEGWSSR